MKIWFLVGQSGTGKDTIMNRVLEKCPDIHRLVTCTTRDKRENEIDGKEYWFKTDSDYYTDLKNDLVVESRCYHLNDKDVFYYTLDKFDKDKTYIAVGTINQCFSYKVYFGEDIVMPVKVELDDYTRLIRGIERERLNHQDYREVCRRFNDEFNEYTEKNFKKLNFVTEIENIDLDACCEELIRRIRLTKD